MEISASTVAYQGEISAVQECQSAPALRAGDYCLVCKQARLDYNGLLDLACPSCGFSQSGGFT